MIGTAAGELFDPALDTAKREVLDRFPAEVRACLWRCLGSAGGFSGAVLWRGEKNGQPMFALKAWPPGAMSTDRLRWIHTHIAQGAHLPFVPAVIPTIEGRSFVTHAGRLWDVTAWMPGVAHPGAPPSRDRVAAACTALAMLHRIWRGELHHASGCLAIRNRLQILERWRARESSGPVAVAIRNPDLANAIRRGSNAVRAATARAEQVLAGHAVQPVLVQPCLRDIWGAHVLFREDRVTGIIDYGAMKTDHVAVDLARLLGDLVEDDDELFGHGLQAYGLAGGDLAAPDEFVRLLDRTGAVCSVANWIFRLEDAADGPHGATEIAARIDRLAARIEGWSPYW